MALEKESINKTVLEKMENLNLTDSSQTLKIEDGEVTINDKQLKNSSTKKHFFSKYEIGDKLKEGGNGIVFKGKYTSID